MVTIEEQIKEFIQQTNNSGRRSRRLLFFISFASIVSFMLLCSTSQYSWSRLRYEQVLKIDRVIDTTKSKLKQSVVFKTPEDSVMYQPFINNRSKEIIDYESFKSYKAGINGFNLSFTPPFFSVNVDVNYLAVYSGLILSLLLFYNKDSRIEQGCQFELVETDENRQIL